MYFAAMRALLAGAMLLLAALMVRRPQPSGWRIWGILVGAALTFTAIGFGGMFLAGGRITPGLATVISNTQPLIAAVVGYFVLAERLKRHVGAAFALGFMGILIIAVPALADSQANSTPAGTVLVLVGAAGVAIGNVLLKLVAERVDPVMAMAWVLLIGSVPLLGIAVVTESPKMIAWSVSFVGTLAILSVLGTGIAFVLWLDVLRRAPLNRVNSYTFLTPVLAMLLGVVFYGERPSPLEWGGSVAIVAAIIFASRREMTPAPAGRNAASSHADGNNRDCRRI